MEIIDPKTDKPVVSPNPASSGIPGKEPPSGNAGNGKDTTPEALAQQSIPGTEAQQPKFTLPVLKSPQVVVDEVSGMAWIGIPMTKLDPLEAIVILDQAKSYLLQWYKKKVLMAQKIARPGNTAFQRMKSFLTRSGRA